MVLQDFGLAVGAIGMMTTLEYKTPECGYWFVRKRYDNKRQLEPSLTLEAPSLYTAILNFSQE